MMEGKGKRAADNQISKERPEENDSDNEEGFGDGGIPLASAEDLAGRK
jgi:hypothetical protein